jgi:Arm DNA-binding domain
MGIITDKEMASKPTGTDQWFTDPAPRGAGRFLGRITPGGERSFYFRYTTSTGQRDTLAVGSYDPKGREGYLTLAAAREKAAGWSKQYKEGARDLRQHFVRLEADRLQASEDARQQAEKDKRDAATAEQQAELDRQRRLTVKQVFERWAATELAPHIGGDGKRIGRKVCARAV